MATLSRDSLCNIGAVQIPRPKCAGFQFVPTRGRMGFYRSIKANGAKYGIEIKNERGPRRPQLPDAGFWSPPSADQIIHETNNNNIVEKPLPQHSPSEQSYSDLSSDCSGSTKFSIAPMKKNPPPAPPLPPPSSDAARLPPRPPRGGMPSLFKKHHKMVQIEKKEEPPVDYDMNEEVVKVFQNNNVQKIINNNMSNNNNINNNFRRQAPVTSKIYRQPPSDYETNLQNHRKYSQTSSNSTSSSGSKFSERF